MAPVAPDEEEMLDSATRAMQEMKALTKDLGEARRRHSEKRKVCEAAERDEEEASRKVEEASQKVKVAMKRLYYTASAYFLAPNEVPAAPPLPPQAAPAAAVVVAACSKRV